MDAKSLQLCLTLCNPMDLTGFSIHGILQAIMEWVAMPLFQGIFPTQGSNPRYISQIHRDRK